jgi:hypothetical protein
MKRELRGVKNDALQKFKTDKDQLSSEESSEEVQETDEN